VHVREAHKDCGIAPVMIRSEEGLRIGLDAEISFIKVALDHERFTIVAEASQELAAYSEPRGSVAGTLFDAREREENSACRLCAYACSFCHGSRHILGSGWRRITRL
jgi:hypothetical protein